MHISGGIGSGNIKGQREEHKGKKDGIKNTLYGIKVFLDKKTIVTIRRNTKAPISMYGTKSTATPPVFILNYYISVSVVLQYVMKKHEDFIVIWKNDYSTIFKGGPVSRIILPPKSSASLSE